MQVDSNLAERAQEEDFCALLDEMSTSMSSARATIQNLLSKKTDSPESLSTKDGISLLSLKHHVLLSYLQSLTLLVPVRLLGESLSTRSPPELPFSNPERTKRGSGGGDLVDSLIEGRLVLEKIKTLEDRMRYQIDKLVRVASEDDAAPVDDPLAFKPNPANFANDDEDEASGSVARKRNDREDKEPEDGIYHPPRLAAMPYTEASGKGRKSKDRREAIPQTLAALRYQDSSMPHSETTSGLGATASLQSKRTRELKEMEEYEEENFTRLVLGKKEAKRRARDEEDIALGGGGGIAGPGGRSRRGAGGLEDEFGDILRSVARAPRRDGGDGYDELRKRGKKSTVLERSRVHQEDESEPDGLEDGRKRKRSRFEAEQRNVQKKHARSRR